MSRLKPGLIGFGMVAFVLATAARAQATPIAMQVFKASQAAAANCPQQVTITEQAQPYREGGYTIDGSADLSQIADRIAIGATDAFSVTWVGTLKPAYRQCQATAGMAKKGNETYQGHSYLRLRFSDRKVYLILDMTGMRDANEFTTVILRQGVQGGKPFWSWGGTD